MDEQAIGKKSTQLAEGRRVVIQAYIRNVVTLACGQEGTALFDSITKEALLATLPFFAEDTLEMSGVPDFEID